MFFSPPSFPHALNQKKDDCVQKAREGMGNPGKAWEIPARHGKSPGRQNPRDSKIPGNPGHEVLVLYRGKLHRKLYVTIKIQGFHC